mmetsp:Transcript_8630/g.10112  ORF Transcript_8630/g.10112 Transcript_8630/m.10112 type:complete len:544 (-) Transcript_8630:157-1788(-)
MQSWGLVARAGSFVPLISVQHKRVETSSRSCLKLQTRGGQEFLEESVKLGLNLVGEEALGADRGGDVGSLLGDGFEVHLLERGDVAGGDLIEETSVGCVQDADLLLDGHGHVLLLLEDLDELLTSSELLLGGGIKVGAELGESGDLTVLGELELQGTGDLLHGLNLGGGADTGHGETDIDGGADTLMEELSLEEDLTIGNGDDIGGDIGGHITSLGLNDGEGGEGTGTSGITHLGRTLEETRVKIENITGVGLTTGGSSEEERHLTVGNSLLGQIVVDDEGVLAVVTEELADGTAGVGGQELEGGGFGGSGSDDNGVLHAVSILEQADDVGNGGALLADSDVDAVEGLGVVTGLEDSLLVDDGVDSDGGLAGLSVTNDKLTLASTNGHEGVHRLQASLHGLMHGFPGDDARGLQLDSGTLVIVDGALSVNGVTERVDDSAEEALADGDINDGASSLDDITFLDLSIGTKDDNTDVVSLQVESHTLDARLELDHLTGLDLGETEDSGDTITDGDDGTELLKVVHLVDAGNLGLENRDGIADGRL